MRRKFRTYVAFVAWAAVAAVAAPAETARGVVFHDQNGNAQRDVGEPGLAGVRVSNGREVVKTDAQGRYELPISPDAILWVVKPRNWMTPTTPDRLPRFFYLHKPAGSPADFTFPGVDQTGPLPEAIDFPLTPHPEPDAYEVLVFGDTQPRDLREVEFIAHDVVDALIGQTGADFGVTLGDVVFDDLSVMAPLNEVIGKIGVPWYNVHGNHDMNYDAAHDAQADETWERVYGPATYSFDWGPVHYVVLDDVHYHGKGAEPQYHGEIGAAQLEWLRNDLSFVPAGQLVVLLMHIPLGRLADSPAVTVKDQAALLQLLAPRPHTLSLSAHTHIQEHQFLGAEFGWSGVTPHHHYNVATVCGSWWTGAPDENGIPHTMMRCGAPNGYNVLKVNGTDYAFEFVPARRPPSEQLAIYAPEEIGTLDGPQTEVIVNVFAGSGRSTVEMRVNDGGWEPLAATHMIDPYFAAQKELEALVPLPGRKLPKPLESGHIWKGTLPARLAVGTHVIEVRTRDMFGHVYSARRLFRVR